MNRCKSCGVFVKTNKKTCPLCGDVLDVITNDSYEFLYPKFEVKASKENLTLRLLTLLSIIGIVVSLTVNYLLNPIKDLKSFDITKYWSIVSLISVITINVIVKYMILSKDNFAKRLIVTSIFVSLTVVSVDYFLNSTHTFSLDYVITFIQMAVLLTLILMVVISKKLYSKYFTFILYSILLNIIQILFLIFNLSNVSWVVLSSVLFGIFTFLGMIIICPKQTKKEFSKRLHI